MAWCLISTGTTLRSPFSHQFVPMNPPKQWAVLGSIVTCLYHSQYSPLFLGRLSQLCPLLGIRPSSFHFFGFRNNILFTEQGRQPCVQPPTWRTRSLYLCPPVTQWPSYTPGNRVPFSTPSTTRRVRVEVF
jgi:hypothetical protein